jgi:hypothetical protein
MSPWAGLAGKGLLSGVVEQTIYRRQVSVRASSVETVSFAIPLFDLSRLSTLSRPLPSSDGGRRENPLLPRTASQSLSSLSLSHSVTSVSRSQTHQLWFRDSSSSRIQNFRCKNQEQVKSQSGSSSSGCTSDMT